jgi:hypothetical protein
MFPVAQTTSCVAHMLLGIKGSCNVYMALHRVRATAVVLWQLHVALPTGRAQIASCVSHKLIACFQPNPLYAAYHFAGLVLHQQQQAEQQPRAT